ncbi:DUF732 domain-containing protein [Mycobacterium sp. CBMA247]|nr:DUF732 domain-containing protein [Mycolicibacterium sp. CBMA 329]MUL86814.1 DUF732 domain-containing protein [Mycolicibacterium sp. CBMA 331]MUL98901.1 DUF732 domain-containing protein [Mycolicibacterium sp. CBMA 334]MUM29845.1 DUF732 domain-containing protein [Mycolicibacterium sp. CBMA 295]MUM37111.1 DUF732 domain-containing protein [Mycolicibacterium sp. CBMA 247]MUM42879.1 DUF732 domain-containing protein [Mycolicibacterium sp. CBMA 294]
MVRGVGRRKAVAPIAAALVLGTLLGATAPQAGAWPIPLTAQDTNYLKATRGVFPGDDDQLLLMGREMCRLLYTGQPASAVIDQTAGQYGATPDQTAVALRAARRAYCTQAPG